MIGEEGDFLDEIFDQSLIKLCNVGFLSGDEVLQFLDSVHDSFPAVAVDFGLFLLVAEPENLIGDGIVVLFIVCLLDELFLPFFEPCLNAAQREGVSNDHSFGDVLLQGF